MAREKKPVHKVAMTDGKRNNKGCILKECARECEIYINTAFMWRHKISNALRREIRLTGTGL